MIGTAMSTPWLCSVLYQVSCSVALQTSIGFDHVKQVEALAALEKYDAASAVIETAAQRFPPFAKTAEWKSIRRQLDRLLR